MFSTRSRTQFRALGTVIMLFASTWNAQAQQSLLTGKVVGGSDNEPLPGANIIVTGTLLGTTTAADGTYVLKKLPPGQYTIKASMMGFRGASKKVFVRAGGATTLDFELEETVIEAPAVVVTASKMKQSFAETPNSVSILGQQTLARRNDTSVERALEFVPGVYFMGSQINIRGSSGYSRGAGSRVLYLIDGMPLMPGDSGDIKWDLVPPNEIDRVEIVRGAGSSLYGSYAVGGIVNVITREPAEKTAFRINSTVGVYDQPRYEEWRWTDRTLHFSHTEASASGRAGKVAFLVSGGRRMSTGYGQNGHYSRWNGLAKLKASLSESVSLDILALGTTDRRGEVLIWQHQNHPLLVPPQNLGNSVESYKASLGMVLQHTVSEHFTHKLRASLLRNRWENHFKTNNDNSTASNLGIEYQAFWLPRENHALTFGTEFTRDGVIANLFGTHSAFNLAAFAQDEVKLPWNLSVTGGLRVDYHQVKDGPKLNQVNPKLGLSYFLTDQTILRAAVGRGFRSPTVAELYSDIVLPENGIRVLPNPDLVSERSWTYEIGIRKFLGTTAVFEGAVFRSDFDDFIDPKQIGSADLGEIKVRFMNVTRARITGFETSLNTGFFRNLLTGSLNYTYLNPKDLGDDRPLPYRPKHMVTSSLNLRVGRFDLGLDGRYMSRIERYELYDYDDRVAQKVVDAHISTRLAFVSIHVNAYNLLGYYYTQVERSLAPIRHFSVTLRIDG